MRRLLCFVLGLVLAAAVAGCGGSSSHNGSGAAAPKGHYAESQKCRDQAKTGMALLARLDEMTEDDGSANMDKVGDEVGKLGVNAPDVVMYCSAKVWEPYDLAQTSYDNASNIEGNACFENFMPRYCDKPRMQAQLKEAVKRGRISLAAVNRKTTNSNLPAPDDGTITLRGTLRLYKGIRIEPNGPGDYFCLGKRPYDDLYYDSDVTVTTTDGAKVAIGTLDQGEPVNDLWLKGKARKDGSGLCLFRFTVPGVPDRPTVYHTTFGDIDGQDFTLSQYRKDWTSMVYSIGFDG